MLNKEQILEKNKARNVAALNAALARMGITRPLPRSQSERLQLINGIAGNPALFATGDEIPKNPNNPIADDAVNATEPEIKDGEINPEGWTAIIESWTPFTFESFTTGELLRDCLGVNNPTKAEQMTVSDILRGLGYTKKRESRNGTRDYFWSKPA